MEVLQPAIVRAGIAPRATLLLGTVQGDIHDIGKNLVKMMFEGAGYKVIDLDINVKAERFLEAYHREKPDLVGLSALLTSTIGEMEKVIQAVREYDPEAKFIVGGAPINQAFADRVGANGYAPDAGEAVKVGNRIIGLA
jgi:methanogenic corrinoid protein MtbC1